MWFVTYYIQRAAPTSIVVVHLQQPATFGSPAFLTLQLPSWPDSLSTVGGPSVADYAWYFGYLGDCV